MVFESQTMYQKQTLAIMMLMINVPLAGCAGSDESATPTGTEPLPEECSVCGNPYDLRM